jgi:hypothetical protein
MSYPKLDIKTKAINSIVDKLDKMKTESTSASFKRARTTINGLVD